MTGGVMGLGCPMPAGAMGSLGWSTILLKRKHYFRPSCAKHLSKVEFTGSALVNRQGTFVSSPEAGEILP